MNVKRYIAANIQEAMIKVKNELGRDAIILHTRKIKQKGFKRWFKKPLVEVVAAVEEAHESPVIKPIIKEEVIKNEPVLQKPLAIHKSPEIIEKPKITENYQNNDELSKLKEEMNEIKNLIRDYMEPSKEPCESKVEVDRDCVDKENPEKHVIDYLKSLDIHDNIIEKIMNIVKRQINLNNDNEEMFKAAAKQAIKDFLGTPYTIDHIVGTQKVYVFVGPTGVGKTTTLAKLAAKLSLLENKKVGLITADTYRIAAVDQLKTYSEILGIPLSVIYEASELSEVLYKYKDKDVILIDTAGRSHKSEELSRDLQDLLNNLDKPEIFLVLSLTTGYKDIINILDAYSFIKDHKVIFTKLDEASSFSNMLNVKVNSGCPLSYITTGQSVPDDIETAHPEKVLDYIVGDAK